MKSDRDRLASFIERRCVLIERLDAKQIDKDQFIQLNYDMISEEDMRPYLKVDQIDKALYNYHYYNILAKYHNHVAIACRPDRRGRKRQKEAFHRRDNYYREKDKVIFCLLDLLRDEKIEAYPITIDSKRLNNALFEIVLPEREKCVLHSKDLKIRAWLKEHGVFDEMPRRSVIHDYVNRPY